ncbi:MAG: DNA alkylation repair protein [Oscillospiraceae bacterium]|nr:DNA alkylation repair protein [Oscillospiraceae bacterium]
MTDLQKNLFSMADEKYKDFQSALIPTVEKEKIIGIRIPILRKFAKSFYKTEEAKDFIKNLPHEYYEENNLHAFLLEYIEDFDEAAKAVTDFLPYVDNWSTCDSLSPKIFKKHKQELLEHIKIWISSKETYSVRFGIKMLMDHFLAEDFSDEYPKNVAKIKSEEYYIRMMQAWYFATALAKNYSDVLPYIENKELEKWVHNKSIQKAIESYRITDEQKKYLKTLKIK